MLKTLRHLAEFILAWLLLGLIRILPLSWLPWTARRLGDSWYLLDRRRQKTAKANIKRAGIVGDENEIAALARQSFQSMILTGLESLRSKDVLSVDNWRQNVTLNIPDATLQLMDKPAQGLILIAGHFGNWETAARIVSYLKPITGIARVMSNPYVENLVQKIKPVGDFSLTPKHDANAARFVQVLKRGDVLAILFDQYAGSRGMMVEFFGHPASTHTSVALLHLVTGVPIVFGSCIRTSPMNFELRASEPIRIERSGDKQKDIRKILERLTLELETVIREYPEQYLWLHRRWRDE